MSKNFDKTVRLWSKKRLVDKRNMRETKKRLQKARVALPVWPAHQPRRSPEEKNVRGPVVA